MKYLLAIDAGTGSIRAVLFDTKGNQIAVSQQEWTHKEEEGVANSMTFDTTENWKKVCTCIKGVINEAKVDAKDILSLSATSMREGIVLYDKKGKELWGVANVDARASKEVAFLNKKFPELEKEFYKESGQTFALGALPRILWVKNNLPKVYKQTANVSMISDWVLAKLSDKIATEPSNGGTTGIFSLKKRDWASKMAKKVGLKDFIFPPVLESGEVLGTVTKKASKITGLSTDTLVVMGGGDVQLGSAGLGVTKLGECAIIGGSFWQQVVNMKSKVTPPKNVSVRVNPHVIDGQSQAEGITFFSGLVMRWFRDAFCQHQKIKAERLGVDTYSLLENMASKVPVGSHGIMPIFSDDMKYGKWYHASPSFVNLSIDPEVCNIASMFRSLQENAAIVSAINLEKIEKFTKVKVDTIVFAGGASKGTLWPQIVADVTGKKVKVPVVKEATALGCAICAGVGAGVYKDIDSGVSKLVKWDKKFKPDMKNHEAYKKIMYTWKKVYKRQLKLVDEGLTTSMWKAPGI